MNNYYRKCHPTILVVCNALDDKTRLHRRIETDSPAASRKVFEMCRALQQAGVRTYVLSLGRGRPDGSGDAFPSSVSRVGGVPVIYAPFSHRYGWSQLLSLLGLLKPLIRLRRNPQRALIFYNRMPAYLPLLLTASLFGYRSFLDLEDGEIPSGQSFKDSLTRMILSQFDRKCQEGALLACNALAGATSIKPVLPYYGTAVGVEMIDRWKSKNINCLMSGTLTSDTGAPLLVEVIKKLRVLNADWARRLIFEVTGKGENIGEFYCLEQEPGFPRVRVHGRTSDNRYVEILRNCHVGLALKPVGGELADTTFPSKVIEFAASGLLVLSTDISDVREVLGGGARYLEDNTPELMINRLAEIARDPNAASRDAQVGCRVVYNRCSPQKAGKALRDFLFREGRNESASS